jgi:hypothetical protein
MNKIKNTRLTEACGWYGMTALIAAYALASFGLIPAEGLAYQLLNLTGAFGLLVIAAAKGVLQAVLTNIFWIAIGVVAIVAILL